MPVTALTAFAIDFGQRGGQWRRQRWGRHCLPACAGSGRQRCLFSITIEGSGSGAFAGEERTLATFTLDGRALGSEQVKIDGRIPRYTRWRATAGPSASDRIRIAISLIRK